MYVRSSFDVVFVVEEGLRYNVKLKNFTQNLTIVVDVRLLKILLIRFSICSSLYSSFKRFFMYNFCCSSSTSSMSIATSGSDLLISFLDFFEKKSKREIPQTIIFRQNPKRCRRYFFQLRLDRQKRNILFSSTEKRL
jgi:hypothetical protein